jgi:hypothetical protein
VGTPLGARAEPEAPGSGPPGPCQVALVAIAVAGLVAAMSRPAARKPAVGGVTRVGLAVGPGVASDGRSALWLPGGRDDLRLVASRWLTFCSRTGEHWAAQRSTRRTDRAPIRVQDDTRPHPMRPAVTAASELKNR